MAKLGDENRPGDWPKAQQRQIDKLETAQRAGSVSIGRWVLTENDNGDLIIRNTISGVETTLAGADG